MCSIKVVIYTYFRHSGKNKIKAEDRTHRQRQTDNGLLMLGSVRVFGVDVC